MHCPSAIRAANEILEVVLTLLNLEKQEQSANALSCQVLLTDLLASVKHKFIFFVCIECVQLRGSP